MYLGFDYPLVLCFSQITDLLQQRFQVKWKLDPRSDDQISKYFDKIQNNYNEVFRLGWGHSSRNLRGLSPHFDPVSRPIIWPTNRPAFWIFSVFKSFWPQSVSRWVVRIERGVHIRRLQSSLARPQGIECISVIVRWSEEDLDLSGCLGLRGRGTEEDPSWLGNGWYGTIWMLAGMWHFCCLPFLASFQSHWIPVVKVGWNLR